MRITIIAASVASEIVLNEIISRLYIDVNLRIDINIGIRVYPVYCTICRAPIIYIPAVLTDIKKKKKKKRTYEKRTLGK